MHSRIGRRLLSLGMSIVCMSTVLVGCASTAQETKKEDITVTVQEMQQPLAGLEYEIPVSTVKVMVDRNGYQPIGDKHAYFIGEDLAEEFRVVNADTYEVVYTGTIGSTRYDENQEQYVSIGEFTEFDKTGSYYIETEKIGRSYTFAIQEDMYEQMLQGILESGELLILEKTPQSVCEAVLGMHTFFIALQNHGAVFEKDNHLVSWLLKMADWLMTCQSEDGGVFDDYEATAAYCGIMSMCANQFGKYAQDMLNSYEGAASKAWEWMNSQPEESEQEDALFYAQAQLFKASKGDVTFQQQVATFLEEHKENLVDNMYIFLGASLYLNTERNTDRDLCTQVMQKLVSQTEQIGEQVKENSYSVYTTNIKECLQHIFLVCFVDYITPSNEYVELLESTLHYIAGANGSGNCYLNTKGEWLATEETADWTLQWNGIVLYCLSDILDDEKE